MTIKDYTASIKIRSDGSNFNVLIDDDEATDVLADALQNEMNAALADICERLSRGGYIGGYEYDPADGSLIKPIRSTHEADRPRSSVEQLREKGHSCARHEARDDCLLFGCVRPRPGEQVPAQPVPMWQSLDDRLSRLETACAGILRDHEIRQMIAQHGLPNGNC